MRSIIAIIFLCFSVFAAPIELHVDATDAPRRLFHVRMTMPATPGPMTLLYPEWIPGEHAPTGPIVNLVGLKIEAGGKPVAWRRDSENMFAFHIDVPAGVSAIDATYDFISPPEAAGFTAGSSTTTELAVLNWNQLVLYPEGTPAASLQYRATLRVPNSWRYGTALPIERETGNDIEFSPAPLNTLIDSPVSAGVHYKTVDLGSPGGVPHYLHIAADSDGALDITPAETAGYRNLVAETGALFGSRHYRDYHFLLTLSDHVAHFGLEHHESSDDRVGERTLIDPDLQMLAASLLPHEFVHSWNGKFRRPAGLATGGYDKPMKDDLLWVYEGLTNYLGEILAPRSGLRTPEQFRESLAIEAAALDNEYGRTWRPLADTATAAQVLYGAGNDYDNYRRGVDFYPEGTLIWLEADVLIRQLSHGAKSLNDFCRGFEGGPGGAPALKPYTFEDVVAGMNAIQPYDWAGFFNTRLHSLAAHAPLGGIEHGGWKLTYTSRRSAYWKALEERNKTMDLTYSLGLKVKEDGDIVDVAPEGPAAKAGVAPATELIAVNSRQFTPAVLREALDRAATATAPIELLVQSGEYYKTYRVDYHGGERYPHLVRDESTPDLLSKIIAPLATH